MLPFQEEGMRPVVRSASGFAGVYAQINKGGGGRSSEAPLFGNLHLDELAFVDSQLDRPEFELRQRFTDELSWIG
jgi:hypothetical protein